MTRTTFAAATAMILAVGGASPARADGWAWGLSIGVGFPIGNSGWGGISVGFPIGSGCGYGYGPYRDPWPYYSARGVCSPAYYRPVCERPYSGAWGGPAYAASGATAAPARAVAARAPRTSPPPPASPPPRVESEPEAWKALAAGDPDAMEIFGRLVAKSRTAGTPEIGYAICAAQAGQLDRAEWAAGQAMRAAPDVWTRIPNEAGIKTAASSALASIGEGETHAQLAIALRRVTGATPPNGTATAVAAPRKAEPTRTPAVGAHLASK